MTAVLIKGGNLETDMNRERMTCQDEGRDWGDVLHQRLIAKLPEVR